MRRETVKVSSRIALPSSVQTSMRRPFTAFLTAGPAVAACLFLALPASSQSRAPEAGAATKAPAAAKPTTASKDKWSATQPERRAECAWIGQRIISLLWRDDVNTASAQTRFYERFGCPEEHLPVAFRCVIEQSESQPEQNDLNARVYACWMAPEARDMER